MQRAYCACEVRDALPPSLLACRDAGYRQRAGGRKPVKKLDLSALSVTPMQLLTISKHLTALETLRMRLALRHTLHFTFSGMVNTSSALSSPAFFFDC